MRIAIVLDDELPRRQYADRLGRAHVLQFPAGGAELARLAAAGVLDAAVVGVLNRDDLFWPAALRDLAVAEPALALVGVVEPLRPSLDEAAQLASEIPSLGFVSRPDARFDWLVRRRWSGGQPPTFAAALLQQVRSLPLADVGRDFALLQALVPSLAFDIPEQAAALRAGRRKLERWFQGPDICSARRLRSVCAAAEAMYLRLVHDAGDREIAGAIGLLTRDGSPSPVGVPREIRAVFGEDRAGIREVGVEALAEAVGHELRRPRLPGRVPARWEPSIFYTPSEGVLAVPRDGRDLLADVRGAVEYPLDDFGADAWELLGAGAVFHSLAAELAARRREGRARTRRRLKEWLGALLALGLVRRGPNRGHGASTAEGA